MAFLSVSPRTRGESFLSRTGDCELSNSPICMPIVVSRRASWGKVLGWVFNKMNVCSLSGCVWDPSLGMTKGPRRIH